MEVNVLLLMVIWTITPFFKKWAMKSVSNTQFLVYQSTVILLLNFIRGYSAEQNKLFQPKFNRWFFFSVTATFLSSIVFMLLCKSMNPSDFVPIIQPGAIMLTTIIDKILGKPVGRNKTLGCTFILMGLIIIHMKTPKKIVVVKETIEEKT